MAQDINLNSEAWRDLIFAGKNKNYGAYQLRSGSNKRHVIAILISLFFVAAIISTQILITTFEKNQATTTPLPPVDGSIKVTVIDDNTNKKEQIIIAQPKEKKFIASIKVVPPRAAPKELITKEATIHTNDDILLTNKAIAMFDVESNVKRKDGDIITMPIPPQEKEDTKDNSNEIHRVVEQKPDFPGGYNELMKYLGSNLRYPVPAIEQGVEGKVTVQFVVSKTGKISGVKILQSLHPLCDKEAERLIKSMPDWIPGKQNGNPVNVYYTIPIRFKLQQQ